LRKDCNLPVTLFPLIDTSDREKSVSFTIWQYGLTEKMSSAESTKQGKEYKQKLARFQENINDNAVNFSIPRFDIRLNDSAFDEGEVFAKRLARKVAKLCTSKKVSRIGLISTGKGEDFVDIHSFIILGLTLDKQDVWVLHKNSIGESVSATKLSDVIEARSYMRHHKGKTLTLSLPIKKAADLLMVVPIWRVD